MMMASTRALRAAILASVLLAQAAALAPAGNLALRGGAFSRKTFNLGSCLQDHANVLQSIPKILDGYVGPNKMDPATAESCMAAVNSVNNCPYCTSLHGLERFWFWRLFACVRACVRALRACVCMCVRACVRVSSRGAGALLDGRTVRKDGRSGSEQ
jgi:hypothetical protein